MEYRPDPLKAAFVFLTTRLGFFGQLPLVWGEKNEPGQKR
jgi:hypothetical protein